MAWNHLRYAVDAGIQTCTGQNLKSHSMLICNMDASFRWHDVIEQAGR